jgi:hypothetical protein
MPARFKNITLGAMVLEVLSKWRQKQEGHRAPEMRERTAAASPDDIQYAKVLETLHSDIELAGFETRLRIPIDLEELYVPLHANVDLRAVGEADFADAADAETVLQEYGGTRDVALVEAFREAFQRKRRGLVILGDPGSGKTTHLKRVLL